MIINTRLDRIVEPLKELEIQKNLRKSQEQKLLKNE